MAWVRRYSAANLVGAGQEAQLIRRTEQCVCIASNVDMLSNDRINNIGTEVPQCKSSWEQIGQGHIGTFAVEGIGVGGKTAHGKRPATLEFSLGLGFGVTLGLRVRLRAVSYTHLTLPTKRIV